jgi:transcriptional regulator with XRE-family HTH domain
MTFAERLKELRIAAGLSEHKLADVSGIPRGGLHTYAIGTRTPSFPAVLKICRALGVTCLAFADCDDVLEERPAKGKTAKPKVPKKGKGK